MQRALILILAAISFGACTESTPNSIGNTKLTAGTNLLPQESFNYRARASSNDDCPSSENCNDAIPLTICDFIGNLGTLAIVEVLGEPTSLPGTHCPGQTTHKLQIRVMAVIAGEPLDEELTLHSNLGGFEVNDPGDYALVQIRNFDGDLHNFKMLELRLGDDFMNTADDQDRVSELPQTFNDWVDAAASTQCFSRLSEDTWNRINTTCD